MRGDEACHDSAPLSDVDLLALLDARQDPGGVLTQFAHGNFGHTHYRTTNLYYIRPVGPVEARYVPPEWGRVGIGQPCHHGRWSRPSGSSRDSRADLDRKRQNDRPGERLPSGSNSSLRLVGSVAELSDYKLREAIRGVALGVFTFEVHPRGGWPR